MKDFARTARRAAATAAIGIAFAAMTAGPAAAREDGPILVYKQTFSTKDACYSAGNSDVRDNRVEHFQCSYNKGKWDYYWVYY